MLMPSIFRENLFDDFFDFPFGSFHANSTDVMKTDIKDHGDAYEIIMNLPGFKKEDVTAELKDGYLKIQAVSDTESEEKGEHGTYIRRERHTGSCSRSFFVGEQVSESDIQARFENGTLGITVPKKEPKPIAEDKKFIAIEG